MNEKTHNKERADDKAERQQAAGIIANEIATNPDITDDAITAYESAITTVRTAQKNARTQQVQTPADPVQDLSGPTA